MLSLCSCTQVSAAPMTWSEETQDMIKRDFARYENNFLDMNCTAEDVFIHNFYGIYQDNALALRITTSCLIGTFDGHEDEIADFLFSYNDYNPFFIYYKRTFTPLKEAYEKGIVSKEDVGKIYELYNLGMNKDMYDNIRKDYVKYRNGDIKEEEVKFDCYRVYNDNIAAILILSVDSFAKIVEEDIAGFHFTFSSTEPIRIYKDGVFTPLKEAYEEGIVSKDIINDIHICHEYRMSDRYRRLSK